jgi:O-antigen/teichoic acid export membrane protein
MSVRLALMFSFGERYVTLGLFVVTVVVTSRLMTPAEVGVVAIGGVVLTLLEVTRDFGVGAYIIQSPQLTQERLRSAVTFSTLFCAALVAGLLLAAAPLAAFYRTPELADYLRVCAAAQLFAPFNGAIIARLQRDMAFGALAAINIASATLANAATIAFALAGWSALSFALANLFGAIVCLILCLVARPDARMFRPRFADFADIARFGAATTAIQTASRLVEAMPQLAVSATSSVAAAGLFSRASTLCQLPDKILGTGVANVALPAIAARLRAGRPLRDPLLKACAYLTALQWPATAAMIALAHPIALIVLGPGWGEVAPVAQIMLVANFFRFPAYVCGPTLIAAGRPRALLAATLLFLPALAGALALATPYGPTGAALAVAATAGFRNLLPALALRSLAPFRARLVASVLAPSFAATLASLVGPLALTAWRGGWIVGIGDGAAAAALAALGWLAAMMALRHPMIREIETVTARLRARRAAIESVDLGHRG